jgi:hypothetical protein
MKKVVSYLWLGGVFLASAGGIALFVILFIPDFNIYWVILSPIIFALYQSPAVFLYYLWKKRRTEK